MATLSGIERSEADAFWSIGGIAVKLSKPSTREAVSFVVNGGLKARTR
jgi:hypothetical protein